MMSDNAQNSMSASELKSRLYQTFKQRGWDDALKVQLRKKLVNELQQSALKQDLTPAREPNEATPLTLRAVNSLIADHLRRCQYEYSLSVFLPESETSREKMFTVQDLLELLHVQPHSVLYKKLATEIPYYEAKGFLWQLLVELVSAYGRQSVDKVIQVDELPAYHNSIEKKLSEVDDHYNNLDGERRLRSEQALQERMVVLQKELEAKIRAEMNAEMSRYKATELKRIELDLKEKSRKEIADARKEMETALHSRMAAAEAREKAASERSRQQQQALEQETYSQRQNLLQQLRDLQQRETDLKREAEVNARAAKLEEDRRKAIEDNLKFREAAVGNIEQNYERKFQEEVKRFQLDQEVKWKERLHDLERKEKLMKEERRKLAEEKQATETTNEELKTKNKEIQELQDQLQESRSKVMSETHRNQMLSEKLRSVVDYPMMKEDNAVLRRELENTKMRLAEAASEEKAEKRRNEELIKQLTDKMSRPSPEVISFRGELERARDQLYQERTVCKQKEEHWKIKVQEEVQRSHDLRRQLDDQNRQMQEMVTELSNLRTMLRETQRALHNEVYRRNDSSPSRRDATHGQSLLTGNLSGQLQEAPLVEASFQVPIEGPLTPGGFQPSFGPIRAQLLDDSEGSLSSVGSTNFIEETRSRMRQLEIEADTLNRNYQEFQQRLAEPVAGASPYSNAGHGGSPQRRNNLHESDVTGEPTSDLKQTIKRMQLQDQEFDGSSQFRGLGEQATGYRGQGSRKQLFQEDPERDDRRQESLGNTGGHGQPLTDGQELDRYATRITGGRRLIPNHQNQDVRVRQEMARVTDWEDDLHLHQRMQTDEYSGKRRTGDGTNHMTSHVSSHMISDMTMNDPSTGSGYGDAQGSGRVTGHGIDIILGGEKVSRSHLAHLRTSGVESGLPQGYFNGTVGGLHNSHLRQQGVQQGDIGGVMEEQNRDQSGQQGVQQENKSGTFDEGNVSHQGNLELNQRNGGGISREEHERERGGGETVGSGGETGGSVKPGGSEGTMDEERRQQEEAEQKEWEERRQRKEEERRQREEEARARERQMLQELQQQETSNQMTTEPLKETAETSHRKTDDRPTSENGEKLDPVMAKYMAMAQRRSENDGTPPKEESELSTGELSQGSISGDNNPDSPIGRDDSKSEDPFEDW